MKKSEFYENNSITKKCLSIINGCYSIDEKLQELYNSYRWADSQEEKEQIKLIYEYYRFAITQFRTDADGSVYVWHSDATPDFYGKASSYSELIEKLENALSDVNVERFIPTEQGLQKLISVKFTVLNNTLCETGFNMDEVLAQADFEEDDIEKYNKAEQLLNILAE